MFRQMVFKNKKPEPVWRFQQIVEDRHAWNVRVAKELQEMYGRRPVTMTDHLTGSDYIAGLEVTSSLTWHGWSKYDDTPYLVPTRGVKGAQTRELLKVLGTSPPYIRIMAEEFDVPPYFRTDREVYYPGFDLAPSNVDDYEADQTDDLDLYVLYNIWPPDYGGDVWDGGDWFEPSTMERYYGLKGF